MIASLAACTESHRCTLIGCLVGATIDVVELDDPSLLDGAMIAVCRNDRCSESPLPLVTRTADGQGARLDGDLFGDVTVWRDDRVDGIHVGVTVDVYMADDLANGDVYTVDLRSFDRAVLASGSVIATSYHEWYPNGPDCGPACKHVDLRLFDGPVAEPRATAH